MTSSLASKPFFFINEHFFLVFCVIVHDTPETKQRANSSSGIWEDVSCLFFEAVFAKLACMHFAWCKIVNLVSHYKPFMKQRQQCAITKNSFIVYSGYFRQPLKRS